MAQKNRKSEVDPRLFTFRLRSVWATPVSGFELRLIGENLARPLDLLDTVCSQLADFNLVQKTSVPA